MVTLVDPTSSRHQVLSNHNYRTDVLHVLSTDFVMSDPAYRVVSSAPYDVLCWADLPWFSMSETATRSLIPSGFREGGSLSLRDESGREVGSLHASLRTDEFPTFGRHVMLTAASELLPLVVAARAEPDIELSERERQVLTLVSDGHSNKEIAATLTLSESTIRTHIERILAKLDAPNRTAAATRAVSRGLL